MKISDTIAERMLSQQVWK